MHKKGNSLILLMGMLTAAAFWKTVWRSLKKFKIGAPVLAHLVDHLTSDTGLGCDLTVVGLISVLGSVVSVDLFGFSLSLTASPPLVLSLPLSLQINKHFLKLKIELP